MKGLRLVFIALAALVPVAQRSIDARIGAFRPQEEILYVGSGEAIRRLSPGFSSLAADLYWLRTVQYFGGQRAFAREKKFGLLGPLIDVTITLDPRFEIAYRYGSIFLSEPSPMGAGEPEAGVALLERGFRENPSAWRLLQQAGYFSFFFLKDDERAVRLLMQAASVPGSAEWLKAMAANIASKAGRREIARAMWLDMYKYAEEGAIKHNALIHLYYLDALDGRDAVQRKVQAYQERFGHTPNSLQDLVDERLLSKAPMDPVGVPYSYDRATGRVSISPNSRVAGAEAP